MDIQKQENETKGSYYIEENGQRLAEMTFSKAGTDRIIIDHTEVSDQLRGQGAGEAMVKQAVEDARAGGYSIIPLCAFALSVFQKTPAYKDVL